MKQFHRPSPGETLSSRRAPVSPARAFLRWLGRAARGTLFADRAFAFGGLAVAPAGTVDALPAFSREMGVAAGLAVRLPFDGPWARLVYRVDQTRLAGGRRETVEAIALGVTMELR